MAPEARSEQAEISMRVMPTVCPMEVTACRRRVVGAAAQQHQTTKSGEVVGDRRWFKERRIGATQRLILSATSAADHHDVCLNSVESVDIG